MSDDARHWHVLTCCLAVLNLLFATLGIYFVWQTLRSTGFLSNTEAQPFVVEAFYAMTVANVILLIALVWAGCLLLRNRKIAVTVCNLIFLAECAYVGVAMIFPVNKGPLRMSVDGAFGIGNMGLAPQLMVAYPLLGLAVLNIGRYYFQRRLETSV